MEFAESGILQQPKLICFREVSVLRKDKRLVPRESKLILEHIDFSNLSPE